MGWFDDSDGEEEEVRKPPMRFFDEGLGLDSKAKKVGINDDDDEDTLDAYMKTLDNATGAINSGFSEVPSKSTSSSGGRLDVENEDEATSHWVKKKSERNGNGNAQGKSDDAADNDIDNSAEGIAHRALHSTFQKGSGQQQGNVDIQLQQVKHDAMKYAPIQKCLFPSSQGENTNTTTTRSTSEGQNWRKENSVTCQPPTLDPVYDFAELRDILPEEVLQWNAMKNLTRPTLVQSQTLGVALTGNDAIVTASTGSGKTLSYLWPIVSHLMINHESNSRALVLVPTRELALQVEQIARSMFTKLPLTAIAITGGNMGRYQLSQKLASTKPHCVIATPGRLLDVLSAQQKSKQQWLLPNISFLVLDEADKMIQMGFANQVTQILQSLRPDRQSLLVSATFDSRLQRRCQEWMHNPFRISIGKTGESSKHVTQHVICLPDAKAKLEFLKESLPTFAAVGRTLVFCATRQGVEEIAAGIRGLLPVETLHGDRHLTDRKAALKCFTKGDVRVLVATDVAGRGLDIPQVSTIINFDPAKNWDTHVHRIGRAGRLSAQDQEQQKGSAYTLLLPSNAEFAKAIVRAYQREGRDIPPEVQKLAERNSSRSQRPDDGASGNGNGGMDRYQKSRNTNSYYGPASKRSRGSGYF